MKTFLIGILFSVMAMGQQIPVTTSQQQQLQNLIANAGFENGKAGWVNSGGTFTVQTGTVVTGIQSAAFTASGASQYFQSAFYAIPNGLQGQDCMASINYIGGSSNLQLTVVNAGDSQIVPLANSPTLTATATAKVVKLYFTCPTGSVKIRIVSSASSAIGYFDDMYVGKSDAYPVSQASMFASARWAPAANCQWVGNGSSFATNWIEFTADSDCSTAVLKGRAVALPGNFPMLRVSNLPPGKYLIQFNGGTLTNNSGTGTGVFTIADGITVGSARHYHNQAVGSSSGANILSAIFEYTSVQSDIQFRPVVQGTGGTWVGAIFNGENTQNESDFEAVLYRFPTEAETVVNSKCPTDIDCENVFTAKVSNSGVVSDENLNWINGNCTNANPFVCTFNSSIFSTTPNCYAQAVTLSGSPRSTTIQAQSSSSVSVRTYADGTVSFQDYFNLICAKAPNDYKVKQTILGIISGMFEPVAFYATQNTGQSINASTETAVVYNVEGYDTHNAYDTGTGLFTVPKAGRYRCYCRTGYASFSPGGNVTLYNYLVKNGGKFSEKWITIANVTNKYFPDIEGTENFIVGDVIACATYQNSGSARTLSTATIDQQFSCNKIAD